MINLKSIPHTELQVGNITHFHGARFEIISADLKNDAHRENPIYMSAQGKWIDGEIVPCYFGPTINWHFQGNSNGRVIIEA